jgi:glycosyltransferase involved in cell wall biosynthesis
MTLHDYWTVCHRVNLLTYDQQICPGQKTPAECYNCAFVPHYSEDFLMRMVLTFRPVIRKGLELLAPARLERGRLLKLLLYTTPDAFAERQRVFGRAMEQVDQVVVPSAFIQSVISANGYDRNRIEVVPLGISFPAYARQEAVKAELLRFGFVGTILPTKGLDVLIRAFRSVKAENVRLDIYGREDITPVYVQRVRELAKGDSRITFHGSFSPDQRGEIYRQIDVFVMPSIWHETFSFVAREALQAGIPVIASQVGALQEAVQEGVNGYLFPPNDHEYLGKIIRGIANNPEQLRSLTVPGPVSILQVPEHVDRIELVYQRVWDAKAGEQ